MRLKIKLGYLHSSPPYACVTPAPKTCRYHFIESWHFIGFDHLSFTYCSGPLVSFEDLRADHILNHNSNHG